MGHLAGEIADALINESNLFESEAFDEAVRNSLDQKISDEVEKQLSETDLTDCVINDSDFYEAVLDIVKDNRLEDGGRVEDLQEQLDAKASLIETLASRLDDQNDMIGSLMQRIIRQDEKINKINKETYSHRVFFERVVGTLRGFPFIGNLFYYN